MNLWIDDSKPCPEGWAVARTYDDAWSLLSRFRYETVAFDHDLGDPCQTCGHDGRQHCRGTEDCFGDGTAPCNCTQYVERTGYDLLCAIERGELIKPERLMLITMNPTGRQRMQACIDRMGEWTRREVDQQLLDDINRTDT